MFTDSQENLEGLPTELTCVISASVRLLVPLTLLVQVVQLLLLEFYRRKHRDWEKTQKEVGLENLNLPSTNPTQTFFPSFKNSISGISSLSVQPFSQQSGLPKNGLP